MADYAAAKRLPVDFLQVTFGVTERQRGGRVSLRLPYRAADDRETAVRYRIALTGDKLRWAARATSGGASSRRRPTMPLTVTKLAERSGIDKRARSCRTRWRWKNVCAQPPPSTGQRCNR